MMLQERQSNILDPIHDTLPPSVWENPGDPEPSLKPVHAHFIKKHVYAVLEQGGYTNAHEWAHLYLTGSLCTYQYSDTSDCDVSLFVDSKHLPEWSRAEMIGLMIEGCDGVTLPATPYELQCYVVGRGIHPADLFKPGLRAGYSLNRNRWLNPPDRHLVHDVQAQENASYAYGLEQADKMERLLRYEPDKAVDFWHQIHRRRMRDQTAGKGDFSQSNIVYKFLSQRGLIPAQQTHDHSNGFGYNPMGEEPIDQPLNPRTAATLPKSKIPISQMTPEQLAEYRAAQEYARIAALNWLRDNPRSPDNIVSHWNQTTPEHRAQGVSWYQDAHNAAKQIAKDRGITVNQAAGLIANYSPQQHWATNLEMASRAAAGEIIGGPKQPGQRGFMASRSQAEAAARILNGEDYHNIFRGKKITSFAHLIEHGQDTDVNNPAVVIDRHALGVAHGGYADDGVYTHSGVSAGVRKDGSSPVYDEVANMYRQAADMINANGGYNGVPIQPHQLQAATWLTRQRLNAEGGYSDNSAAVANLVRKVAEGSVNNWNAYAGEHHPTLVGKTPGTGFSAQAGAGWEPEPVYAKLTGGHIDSWEGYIRHRKQARLAHLASIGDLGDFITPEMLSSPTAIERGLSRPVSPEEFRQLTQEGEQRYNQMANNAQAALGLDQNWPKLIDYAYQQTRAPWGGATIDAHTGQPLQSNADAYALTVKPPGTNAVSIPANASSEQFTQAMNRARKHYDHLLQRENHHLGIFHDADLGRIDFDPVVVVRSPHEVESIGAYTNALGGAYHFKSGDGYWPPHVPTHLQPGNVAA